jgi:hypothetical protein
VRPAVRFDNSYPVRCVSPKRDVYWRWAGMRDGTYTGLKQTDPRRTGAISGREYVGIKMKCGRDKLRGLGSRQPLRRVMVITIYALTASACSGSMPSLSSLPTETLRFESQPAGADVKTTSGQTCRTPCELSVQAPETLVTFTLIGHEPQTIAISSEEPFGVGRRRLAPNPAFL